MPGIFLGFWRLWVQVKALQGSYMHDTLFLLPVVVVANLLISNCDKLQFGKFMERDQLCEKAN